ncbi:superoxide dismutase, Cu-Zn family [Pustulibacterium marinum]|uniref:Superoxide dismutase [Cu-Zn] n=1 Tax=Pustulibacterium marinum TaxID=1224947 RepID=A0A1I7HWJ2_9FLAO|nr:superoxide dismutase family protein [Pustulibacterium marinum]SFU64999.1 superoxide dismutase, Cu-Zn family [Pustulibacterium marinum]
MKNSKLLLLGLLGTMAFTSCDDKPKKEKMTEEETTIMPATEMEDEPMAMELSVMMEPKSESTAKGEVMFVQEDDEVKMTAKLSGLEPGMHAIHLHEKADCSAADGKSAGGHWNPTNEKHGKWGDDEGYHKGDIGNFEADEDGNATVEFETDEWCIECEDDTKNIVGKGIIVHQGEDDFTSQPSGDAGARVSCGGIIE